MEQTSRISLWEFLFSGGFLTDFFIVILLVLGVAVLYLFFSKYFYLKEIGSKEEDFLDNVADCIYDHRIEAAMDWCKRVVSPESRIIKKGLENIEKSSFELFLSVQNQREAEITEIKKDIFKVERVMEISDNLFFNANLTLQGVLEKTEYYNKDNKVDKIKEINKFIYVTEAGFSEYFPRIEF